MQSIIDVIRKKLLPRKQNKCEMLASRLNGLIKSTVYAKENGLTVCTMILKSGFVIIGTAGSICDVCEPDDIGKAISYEMAVQKLWEFEAYAVMRDLMNEK